jgi:hypothetical protein
MQHDTGVIGADARDFRHLFVSEVFEKKRDERLFERVQFENRGIKIRQAFVSLFLRCLP